MAVRCRKTTGMAPLLCLSRSSGCSLEKGIVIGIPLTTSFTIKRLFAAERRSEAGIPLPTDNGRGHCALRRQYKSESWRSFPSILWFVDCTTIPTRLYHCHRYSTTYTNCFLLGITALIRPLQRTPTPDGLQEHIPNTCLPL